MFQFLEYSESRAQELPNDVAFFIFEKKHEIKRGGGKIDPSPNISWFLTIRCPSIDIST